MIRIGRPLFKGFASRVQRDGELRAETMALLLLLLMFCAWATDLVGIYSVFGAFIAGAVMPRGPFAAEVKRAIEPVTLTLLLPIFFVYSGLNTRMDLLIHPAMFGVAALILAVAFLSKGGGCMLAARSVGATWREAATIGALMNARGMMELILVNIALERGLISRELFTMLVVMALVTTLAAYPLFQYLYGRHRQSEPEHALTTG